jgi:uncharacterized membrane protein HdeD (DUF308 family)
MKKPLGFALLIGGVILLIFGFQASESFGSEVSKMFSGNPTDKSMWMIIGGAVAAVVGLLLALVPARRLN